MPIQFPCPSCSQPIEVDDEQAGQNAACPYCRRVITVPTETTLEAQATPVARPPSAAPGDVTPLPLSGAGLPQVGADPTARNQTAAAYANYALICTAITLALFCVTTIYFLSLMFAELGDITTQPSPEDINRAQAAVIQTVSGKAWVLGVWVGSVFFAVVGLALGIVSLKQGTRVNWKAMISVILCSLFTLCACGGLVLPFGAAAAGAPGISAP